MSYSGTTAASTLTNPPIQLVNGLGGNVINNGSTNGTGTGLWLYTSTNSATEASSGTNSGAFFSDAYALGMRNGDVIIMIGATGSTVGVAMGVLQGITSTGAGAYMSTGSMVSSTFG